MHGQTDSEKSRFFWYRNYNLKNLDSEITPFLKIELTKQNTSQMGWLEKARVGLFFSTKTLAKKLNITQSVYSKLEANEVAGRISLSTLDRIANAMDCEVVYVIRPKSKVEFSNCVWKVLFESASQHPSLKSYDPKQRPKSIAAIANRLMTDPKFRKAQGWSQRANKKVD